MSILNLDSLSKILRKSGFLPLLTFSLVSTRFYDFYKNPHGNMKLKKSEILEQIINQHDDITELYDLIIMNDTQLAYLYLIKLSILDKNMYWIDALCTNFNKICGTLCGSSKRDIHISRYLCKLVLQNCDYKAVFAILELNSFQKITIPDEDDTGGLCFSDPEKLCLLTNAISNELIGIKSAESCIRLFTSLPNGVTLSTLVSNIEFFYGANIEICPFIASIFDSNDPEHLYNLVRYMDGLLSTMNTEASSLFFVDIILNCTTKDGVIRVYDTYKNDPHFVSTIFLLKCSELAKTDAIETLEALGINTFDIIVTVLVSDPPCLHRFFKNSLWLNVKKPMGLADLKVCYNKPNNKYLIDNILKGSEHQGVIMVLYRSFISSAEPSAKLWFYEEILAKRLTNDELIFIHDFNQVLHGELTLNIMTFMITKGWSPIPFAVENAPDIISYYYSIFNGKKGCERPEYLNCLCGIMDTFVPLCLSVGYSPDVQQLVFLIGYCIMEDSFDVTELLLERMTHFKPQLGDIVRIIMTIMIKVRCNKADSFNLEFALKNVKLVKKYFPELIYKSLYERIYAPTENDGSLADASSLSNTFYLIMDLLFGKLGKKL